MECVDLDISDHFNLQLKYTHDKKHLKDIIGEPLYEALLECTLFDNTATSFKLVKRGGSANLTPLGMRMYYTEGVGCGLCFLTWIFFCYKGSIDKTNMIKKLGSLEICPNCLASAA